MHQEIEMSSINLQTMPAISALATQAVDVVPSTAPILGLHHFAFRCRDAEETRHFYEDLLGLPLYHIIQSDYVPSTGEFCPYTHIFFRMTDGSFVAFFDLGDDHKSEPSPNTPAWVNHLALRVDTVEELERVKARLLQHKVEVLGVTDHHIFKSVYFFDPNGIRLELCAQVASELEMLEQSKHAHEQLARWNARKLAWRAERAQGKRAAVLTPQQHDRPGLVQD
jgi:glyoxylase I family protein